MKKILSTVNYDIFKMLQSNRPINKQHVQRIKNSIRENGYLPTIAIVNRRNEVIDGQHRLQAVKELGLPFMYTVSKSSNIEQAQSMNVAQRPWTMQDFIDSYANTGNKNYIELRKDMQKWGISYLVAATFANQSPRSVKGGTLKYSSSDKLDELIVMALDIQPFVASKTRHVWTSIYKVVTTTGYSHHRMMKQLNAFHGSEKLGAKVGVREYLLMFEDIYNHHHNKTLRFY